MTLMGCALNLKHNRQRIGWHACWRTESGNVIHQPLDLDYLGTSEADAWIYALDHYPVRSNLA